MYRILKGHVVMHVKSKQRHMDPVRIVVQFLLFKFLWKFLFSSFLAANFLLFAVRTLSVKGAFVGHRQNFN